MPPIGYEEGLSASIGATHWGKSVGKGANKPSGSGMSDKVSKWVAIVVAVLGIPAAAYQAWVNWDKMFPPPPSVKFGECSQKNIQFTVFNRSGQRATVKKPEIKLLIGDTPPLDLPDHSVDDPMKGSNNIGPNGEKEFPYPDQVSQYFSKEEAASGCKVSVSVELNYENDKSSHPRPLVGQCSCTYSD